MTPWVATPTEAEALAALKQALEARTLSLPDDPRLTAELLSLQERRTSKGVEVYTGSGERPSRAIAVALTLRSLGAKPEQ